MKTLILFVSLIFLSGCSSVDMEGGVFNEGFFEGGIKYKDDLIIGPKFNVEEIRYARRASNYASYFAGTNVNPNFSQYYWATNMPKHFWGLAFNSGQPNGYVLINPSSLRDSNFKRRMFYFGNLLNHEWFHLKYNLTHQQIDDIHDSPSERNFLNYFYRDKKWGVESPFR